MQHFAGFPYQKYTFVLSIRIIFNVDRRRIAVAEIDRMTDFLRNLTRDGQFDAALLLAIDHLADAPNMGGMR